MHTNRREVLGYDAEVIWVTEVWKSAESHAASLKLPTVKEAISEAMPSLTGEFDQIQLSVVGGHQWEMLTASYAREER
jgi:quinol monooxygenase YgiN